MIYSSKEVRMKMVNKAQLIIQAQMHQKNIQLQLGKQNFQINGASGIITQIQTMRKGI